MWAREGGWSGSLDDSGVMDVSVCQVPGSGRAVSQLVGKCSRHAGASKRRAAPLTRVPSLSSAGLH